MQLFATNLLLSSVDLGQLLKLLADDVAWPRKSVKLPLSAHNTPKPSLGETTKLARFSSKVAYWKLHTFANTISMPIYDFGWMKNCGYPGCRNLQVLPTNQPMRVVSSKF